MFVNSLKAILFDTQGVIIGGYPKIENCLLDVPKFVPYDTYIRYHNNNINPAALLGTISREIGLSYRLGILLKDQCVLQNPLLQAFFDTHYLPLFVGSVL